MPVAETLSALYKQNESLYNHLRKLLEEVSDEWTDLQVQQFARYVTQNTSFHHSRILMAQQQLIESTAFRMNSVLSHMEDGVAKSEIQKILADLAKSNAVLRKLMSLNVKE